MLLSKTPLSKAQTAPAVPSPGYSCFIGFDVAKQDITVYRMPADGGEPSLMTIANDSAVLAGVAAELPADAYCVCEATGGYETTLLAALVAAERMVHRADARKVKAFIRSFGTLAKTDAIDANALAVYGQERHAKLQPWLPPTKTASELQSLVLFRSDLIKNRTAQKNRLQAPTGGAIAVHLEAILATIEEQISILDGRIDDLIQSNTLLAEKRKILTAVAGVGPVSAMTLLALLPELGTLPRRQIASLAGLAPHARQSGRTERRRRTFGGRTVIKKTLYMAALSASRCNPKLKTFYDRMIAAGKKPLIALTAVMRKLIVILNAKIRDQFYINTKFCQT